ncbi:ODV-E66 [Macrobrachium rosenbergii nudivirus]|nr:ODV-E66 [Macrobrachium rosenbergii nudivirus]
MKKIKLYHDSQDGKRSSDAKFIIFVVLIILLCVVIYFSLHTDEPYIFQVNYIYKSNYYKEFILPEDYDVATQGRKWSEWDTNEKGIAKICHLFNESMGFIQKTPKSNRKVKTAIKVIEDWIVAFLEALEKTDIVKPDFQGQPWGGNWYEFSIEAPTTLAYYIINRKSSGAISVLAARAIEYIIVNPQRSLGYDRDKANSAMMLFPWTLAHMVTGTLDVTNPAYLYAIDQYNLAPNENIPANIDGVHLDYSYLTHGGVYAYGYLWSIYNIYPDTKQILPEVKKFNLDYNIDKIYSKLRHPTIDTAGCALWHRQFRLNGSGYYTGKTKTSKCEVVPSMRYIRYFDENVHFSARTMQTSVAYYESDKTVDNMGLYSALCRRIFRKADSATPKFPDVGFIYPKGTTELIRVPTLTTTTTPFFCELTSHSKSFVWTDGKKYGILFQYQMKLPPMLPFMFTEVMCIYLEERRIETHYRLESNGSCIFLDKEYCREEGNDFDVHSGYIISDCDIASGKITTRFGSGYLPDVSDFTGNEYREVAYVAEGKTSAFYIEKKVDSKWTPYSYCPAEEDIMTKELIRDGKKYVFDEKLNLYQFKETV